MSQPVFNKIITKMGLFFFFSFCRFVETKNGVLNQVWEGNKPEPLWAKPVKLHLPINGVTDHDPICQSQLHILTKRWPNMPEPASYTYKKVSLKQTWFPLTDVSSPEETKKIWRDVLTLVWGCVNISPYYREYYLINLWLRVTRHKDGQVEENVLSL